jgi:hypothetical protein
MGTSLLYITASALYRSIERPYLIGGLAIWWGFVRSMIRRLPRYGDAGFRSFLRKYQWDCLVLGKRKATEKLNAMQACQWVPTQQRGRRDATRAVEMVSAAS